MRQIVIGGILLCLLIPAWAGANDEGNGNYLYYLDAVKYDSAGQERWAYSYLLADTYYGDWASPSGRIVDGALNSAGEIVALVTHDDPENYLDQQYLVRLGPEGPVEPPLDLRRYDPDLTLIALAVGADDQLTIVGTTGQWDDEFDSIRVLRPGDWEAVFDEADREYPVDVTTDAGGNVYVSAVVVPALAPARVLDLKYDAAGELSWARARAIAGESMLPCGLALNAQGELIVGSYTPDMLVAVKYDTNGNEQWSNSVVVGDIDDFTDPRMTLDGDGNTIFSVAVNIDSRARYLMMAKFDPDGSLAWTAVDQNVGWVNAAHSVGVDGTGAVLAVSPSLHIVKYDADGNLRWDVGTTRPSSSLAVEEVGRFYVAGVRQGAEYSEYQIDQYTRFGWLTWNRVFLPEQVDELTLHGLWLDAAGDVVLLGEHEHVDLDPGDDTYTDDDTSPDDDIDDSDCALFCSQITLCSLADDFDLYECPNQCHGFSDYDVNCVINSTDCKKARECLADPELDLGCGEGGFGCGC